MSSYQGEVQPLSDLIRARRRHLGLSQADVAEAVGVFDQPTVTRHEVARWERGKRIPRGRKRNALAFALDLPVRVLDLAAAAERGRRAGDLTTEGTDHRTTPGLDLQGSAVQAIRVALLDNGGSGFSLITDETDDCPPDPSELRGELADVMAAYQASRYADMLVRLPEVLSGAHLAVGTNDGERRQDAERVLALASVYGTLLLAGAMASARAGDRQATHDYLDEADFYAVQVGHDANHLWTAFGPTNVAIHRVATSVALGDTGRAHGNSVGIDATRLPLERRVRHAFDLARTHIERREIDDAVDDMLGAERLAPEQVHHHVMSRQIVAHLRRTAKGERSNELAQLAERVQAADYMALGSAR